MKRIVLSVLALVLVCSAFASCSFSPDEVSITYKEVDGGLAVTRYDDKTTITEVTLDENTVEIRDFGLCNAESLKRIYIGKNVKEIGTWSMTNNQHLEEFVVDENNPYFTSVDGVLFTKDMKTLVYYPAGRNITFDRFGQTEDVATYTIPDGVEEIRDKAFYKCYHVNITKFPDSIKHIGEKAFHRCSSLENFDVPSSLEFIGKDAFAYNDKLTELAIGSNIKEIQEYAFFNCGNIKKITIDAKEDSLILGNKWQPTSKGKIVEDCVIEFKK